MAFPATPTFDSTAPDAVWWRVRRGAGVDVCATGGGAFVRTLQARLRQLLPQQETGFDGRPVGAALIAVDGNWGPMTQRAVFQALRNAGAPDTLLRNVRAEAGGVNGRVGTLSYVAAIWLMHRTPLGGIPGPVAAADLVVDGQTVTPPWSSPAQGIDGPVVCAPQPAAASPPPAPPPVVRDTTPLDTGTQPPVTTAPGSHDDDVVVPTTGVQIDLPPGVELPGRPGTTSSVNLGYVLILGGAVAAVGGAVWYLSRPKGKRGRRGVV